jgi:hypothetical protein
MKKRASKKPAKRTKGTTTGSRGGASTALDRAINTQLTSSQLAGISAKVRMHPERKRNAFLVAYSLLGVVSYAANSAGIGRGAHYEWLEEEDYKRAFARAEEIAGDVLEFEARRRAVEGTKKPVYQGGELVGYVTEYSDMLMALLLKGRRRRVFGDQLDMNHSGEIKGGVLMIPTPATAEEWSAVAARQQSALIGSAKKLAEEFTRTPAPTNGNGNGNGKH